MKFGRLPGAKPAQKTPTKGGVKLRARHQAGVMNGPENRYANILEGRKRLGELVDWRFECLKLKLADKTYFTADFFVVRNDGELELVDVKGSGPEEEDARVKIKTAAETYPWFHFAIARERTRKQGGGFEIERFAEQGATVAPALVKTAVKEDHDVDHPQEAKRTDRTERRD
jgi:hypothetical protein